MSNGKGATTPEILFKMEMTDNPVTKSVYRNILGNRIDEASAKNDKVRRQRKARKGALT